MEKFAVDLDKVLDEFEFNEDRAEQLANVLPKRRPTSNQSRRQNAAPPPYRRAPFEPISLADADFAAAAPVPSDTPRQQWNVRNTLKRQGSSETDSSEGSDVDAPYSIPNNINETAKRIGFYDNNSFKDEFMEHKPIISSFPEQQTESPDWLQKTNQDDATRQDNKKAFAINSSLANRVNVTGVFSSLNEYVGAGPKVDVKTVSNDLTANKVKNLDKNVQSQPIAADARNLPDVASTSDNRPALQSLSSADPDPPRNNDNTFDLVTNLSGNEQAGVAPNDPENSANKAGENVDAETPEVANVEMSTEEDALAVDSENNIEVVRPDERELGSETEESKPPVVVRFVEDAEASEAALLTYLRDIENEFDEVSPSIEEVVPVKPSEDEDLVRNLDLFCDALRGPATNAEGATTERGEGDEPKEVRSMHSAIDSTKTPTSEDGSSDRSSRTGATVETDSDDATSTEDEDAVGITEHSAAELETQADSKRLGPAPLVEVLRSPMVQSPRDGNAIHVLGEEERPTRPKYLFLPSRITVGSCTADGEADEEAVLTSQVGPAGATPHATMGGGGREETVDNRPVVEENRNTVEPVETGGTGDHVTIEQLDNRANMDLAGDTDANLSSPDYSESSVETLSPTPLPLAPDPSSLGGGGLTDEDRTLGFVSPFWIPDNEATACMLCDLRFTVLRRRHHCRACGKVLCSKCCGLKARLEYMDNAEGRVCQPCHDILLRVLLEEHGEMAGSPTHLATQGRQPHPNNPMDYCSTIPPLQQVAGALHNPTPSVLVPVGVLKRQGSSRPKSDVAKQVMFSDGIRPGGDLTELDGSGEPRVPFRRPGRVAKRVATPPGPINGGSPRSPLPPMDLKTLSYIPSDKGLPPVATLIKGELKLDDDMDEDILLTALRADDEPPVMFAINRNFYVNVKILNLSCCVNRLCWCFTTQGLRCVGQDEIMLVLETLPNELIAPRDVFCYFNTLYQDAVKGSTVSDLGCTLLTGPFLGSSDHGAFVYIRPSFQCLRRFNLPTAPYLVAILVHRSETPWARVFPIRLVLRLGAEFRYYPCSLVSVRNRKSVYHEIGHTIMNLLADFRNLSYTLPSVRGLVIHMEDRRTTVQLPRNRYDQVTRALNNSNEHVLALAANLSLTADSHLVCVQSEEDLSYHTQAINIHSKPRRVTGASFVVFNGALKTSSNLTAKSSIVEDGLMVQITPDTMLALRGALRNMKDWSVGCGPTGAATPDETVSVQWVDDDNNFNVGVCSVIDGRSLDGVPSIRVHNGTDYLGRSRLVRWTEVFILKSDEGGRTGDPLDVGRLSESIARAVCHALIKLLDLLAQADYNKFAVRASIHPDNVSYEGGSRGETLPPIYMNSLDNELVPVLHTAATSSESTSAVLELVFHVLLQ